MTGKLNVTAARIAARRANINRYRRLLRTQLEPHERQYLLRRLAEEEAALANLGARDASRPRHTCKQRNGQSARKLMSLADRDMIMSSNHQLRCDDLSVDVGDFLHPASAFDHPLDVVRDPDLTLNEKRAILSSWASDACAIESAPALRRTPNGTTVTFDDIVDALRELDAEAAKARWNPPHRLARTLRSRHSRGASGGESDLGLH